MFSYKDELKLRLYVLSNNEQAPLELKNTEYMLNGQIVSKREYQQLIKISFYPIKFFLKFIVFFDFDNVYNGKPHLYLRLMKPPLAQDFVLYLPCY